MENTVKQQTPSQISMRRNFFEGMTHYTPTRKQIDILKRLVQLTKPSLCMEADQVRDMLQRMCEDGLIYDYDTGCVYTPSKRNLCRIRFFHTVDIAQIDILEDGVRYLRTHLDKRGNFVMEYLADGKY